MTALTVGELVERLLQFPDHYRVEILLRSPETDDYTAKPVAVDSESLFKVVLIEIDGMPRR